MLCFASPRFFLFSRAAWLMAVIFFFSKKVNGYVLLLFSAEKWISDTVAWTIVNSMLLLLFTDPKPFSLHSPSLLSSSRPKAALGAFFSSLPKEASLRRLLSADRFPLARSPISFLPPRCRLSLSSLTVIIRSARANLCTDLF